ncbi:hypothetical protein CP532_0991 [Ophiocordyceps camponoti-leonardi (nom. inval.)]|nr:hypothetical protein CP532_0991 [Ophiocordyceps camponoti-leonardi (nom. inval.)]
MTPARNPPTNPLLVVLGSTGTGKSDLAVDLASRFDGEIINADAMQLYKGLPILTNKMKAPDRRGIPHHLLGHISPLDPPWNVDVFRREASVILQDIRNRGKLPILVGGTHYYLDALLFPDVVLDTLDQNRDADDNSQPPHHPLLDEPTHVLLEELRKCDPAMAERWHPNDRRKILRSLEIFLNTGRTASDLYAEQERRRRAAHRNFGPWDKLLFWVHTDRDVLCRRLDSRVDAMLEAGLLDEVRQLYALRRESSADFSNIDVTKGIWQSIGYRQFEPYVRALEDTTSSTSSSTQKPDLPSLQATALEEVKAATRRYASHQTRWIRYKQTRRLRDQGPEAISSLYLLDSTDPSLFRSRVLDPAASVVDRFLRGLPRSLPADLSPRASEILAATWRHPTDPPETPRKHFCDTCQATLLSDEAWRKHVGGVAHRRATVKKKKLALVSCEPRTRTTTPEADRSSSPDIASLF